MKTALLLVIVAYAQQPIGCSNYEMVKLLGGDPLPFKISERYVEFDQGVRFSYRAHQKDSDSLISGKDADYFGKNSKHMSTTVNGIFNFVIQKPQVNIVQAVIKTKLKRVTSTIELPELFYLRTEVENQYAIHQITVGQIKRELFNVDDQTINSLTGSQFKEQIVNVAFATKLDFVVDEDFLEKIKEILESVDSGSIFNKLIRETCEQFFCPAPDANLIASLSSDAAITKIQCSKSDCFYTKNKEKKPLFTKSIMLDYSIPFLQTSKKFRYLDKPQSGLLLAVIEPAGEKSISITAQVAVRCNIKDLDYHKAPYSGAVQSLYMGDQKLYSIMIIEPGYNGIQRSLRQQTPELYDQLDGIEKVRTVYYFMIVSSDSPDTLFDKFVGIIDEAKISLSKKHQCTIFKDDEAKSFLQIGTTFQKKSQPIDEYDYGEEDGEYEYVYEYVSEEDEGIPVDQINQSPAEEDENDDFEVEKAPIVESEEDDPDSEIPEEEEEHQQQDNSKDKQAPLIKQTEQIKQASYLAKEQELCFQAFEDCNYQGASLRICGHQPTIPKELSNFLIRSLKIPKEMKITFFTDSEEKIVLQNNQECLEKPFEIAALKK